MQRALMVPVLAALLFAAACKDATTVDTGAQVRFFNVVWSAPDGIGFTTNDQFVPGSALAYAQSTQSCAKVNAGNTAFGIGLPNADGTALNSNTLATLIRTVTAGGNYTVLAGGHVIHPSVVLLDNSLAGTPGTDQAAVRFVNLAAESEFPFTVLKGTAGSEATTVVDADIAFRDATPFSTVTSGSNAYTIMYDNQAVISGSDATVTLQGGTVNTVVIFRNLSGNFALINVPSCS